MAITKEQNDKFRYAFNELKDREGFETLLGSEPLSFQMAAYLALLVGEEGTCGPAALKEVIVSRLGDGMASRYLDAHLGDGLYELTTELLNRFFVNELKAIVQWNDDRFVNDRSNAATSEGLSRLALGLLDPQPGDSLADFGCGAGSFLVAAAHQDPSAKFFGIENRESAAVLATIRMKVLGVQATIACGNLFDGTAPSTFDGVFCDVTDGQIYDHRTGTFSPAAEYYYNQLCDTIDGDWHRVSKDWIYIGIVIDSLGSDASGVVVLPSTIVANDRDEQACRYFIKNRAVRAVVLLPRWRMLSTNVVLMVLGQNPGPIRMVDGSGLLTDNRARTQLTLGNAAILLNYCTQDGLHSRLVSLDEIEAANYSLYPPRYLGRAIALENAVKLGDVAVSIERGSLMSSQEIKDFETEEKTPYRYLRFSDLSDGSINEDLPYMSEVGVKSQKQLLREGDVVIPKNGKGIKPVVAEDLKGQAILVSGNLYIIRLDTSKVNPYFLAAFLAGEDGQELLDRLATGSVMRNISLRKLKELEVPVPPMEVQDKVAKRYRVATERIRHLKQEAAEALLDANRAYEEILKE